MRLDLPNPVPDITILGAVYQTMTDSEAMVVDEMDATYESQIQWVDAEIEQARAGANLQLLVQLQDDRAELQHQQMQSQRALIKEIQANGGFQWNDCVTQEGEYTNTPSPTRDTQAKGIDLLPPIEHALALEKARNLKEDEIDKETVKSDDQEEMVEYIEDKRKRDQRFTKEAGRLRKSFKKRYL